MIRTKIMLLAALFTAMMVSCDLFSDVKRTGSEESSFYAQNMETGDYYKVKAEMLYEGKKCVIWAEKSAKVSQRTAKQIANEYDTVIRQTVVDTFSKKNFLVEVKVKEKIEIYHFDDMLDFANRLARRDDKKLTILLLDIKDGFKDPETDSYVAGYFWAGNFYEKETAYYSNERDMIYIDTYPGLETQSRQTYATFAHELQHLVNFVTSYSMNRKYMDRWVDEGLSSQAEYLYLGENPPGKCEWFKEDIKGTIAQGNNFFVWDNHRDEPLAILDDYATVYLFFRWLYLQAANAGLGYNIFLDIETSSFYDYKAVTNVAREINPAWGDWETLLRTWLAANYYPNNSYGYTGDNYLQKTITVKPVAGQIISLYPGEGVYSIINSSFSANISGNIRYAGLADNQPAIGTSLPYTGNVLLAFNANTDNRLTVGPETGSLTGVPVPASPTTARSIGTRKLTGPYVIDARDMLNKNKKR